MCICSICSEHYISVFVDQVLKLLDKHAWLMDSYILDFFVNRHWEALPRSWRQQLLTTSAERLGEWLDNTPQATRSNRLLWPLSLLALKAAAFHLSIPRQPEHCSEAAAGGADSASSTHCQHCSFLELSSHSIMPNVFSRYIKPKKFHEINRMAKVASSCAERTGCRYIVDVGSGLGHLGRLLALRHGLKVCCLEEQTNLTTKARKLDGQLITVLSKKNKTPLVPPVHINRRIQIAVQTEEFLKVLKEAFGSETNSSEFQFGIVGLHPCGDLGPTLLRLLTRCPGARFINLVGCCYMKLTDDGAHDMKGYPLSTHVAALPHRLSYEAREVACHAIETYCYRLRTGCVEDLKVHCYRATLETIIVRNWPELKHCGLRSIKHVEDLPFPMYAEQAVERLGLALKQEELDSEETRQSLGQWLRVVAFYSLRLLLAPCVESVILLDRMLYLREAGIPNFLIPAFNPEMSPRNHILVAMKNT